jgi:hypothetical protein
MHRKMLVGLAMVAALAPPALAGPPDGASGKTVLDEVADGVRRYRQSANPLTRIAWLRKLAPTHDPRVTVIIGDALSDDSSEVARVAVQLAEEYYYPGIGALSLHPKLIAKRWWEYHEADIRRRAHELP